MAQETLKITITADNKEAVNNIQQTITATNNLGNAFKQLPNTSNQATNALTNLSRVAQDAPYGFIGIANNLNPLLESFQRLQKEAGSSGNALKAMAQGLAGPAGIGLALGAVSSIIVAFGPKIAAFINGTKQASEEEKKFAESLNNAKASALSHGLQLQSYLKIANDVTIADDKRKQALQYVKNELGKINKNYADSITTVQQATEAVNQYTQALVQQALISKYTDRIAELTIKQAEAQKELNKTTQDYNNVLSKTNKAGLVNQYAYGSEGVRAYNNALVDLAKTAKDKAQKNVADLTNQITELNNDVDKTVKLNINNIFGKVSTGAGSAVTEVSNLNKELQAYIQAYKDLTRPSRAERRTATPVLQETSAKMPEKLSGQVPSFYGQYYAEQADKAAKAQEQFNTQLKIAGELTNVVAGGFNSVFEAFVNGEDVGAALEEAFKRILIQLVEMVAQALIFKAILSALGVGATPYGAAAIDSGIGFGGGNLLGEFLLKGSDLILATQRANTSLNLRRGK